GIDPGWFSHVPSLAQSSAMATCAMNGATAAGLSAVNNATTLPNFKKVISYLVQCALPSGQSVTLTDENNQPWVLSGSLGLAPEWATGAPTLSGQKYVSACLGARTNAKGHTLRISVRGAPSSLTTSTLERTQFGWEEGAYWGNLFTATPQINACL